MRIWRNSSETPNLDLASRTYAGSEASRISDAPRKQAFAKLDWLAEVMQGAKRVVGRRSVLSKLPDNPQQNNYKTKYADMAELADAYGSGPYESDFMQVRPLLSAPKRSKENLCSFFIILSLLFVLLLLWLCLKRIRYSTHHRLFCMRYIRFLLPTPFLT